MDTLTLNDKIKQLQWMIGTWICTDGKGSFPGIEDFQYKDTLVFEPCGKQPSLKYSGSSSHPINGNPMHLESGFLRVRGDESELSFMVAHNFGVTTIEEGNYNGIENEIKLKSKDVCRMSGSKDPAVIGIERKLKLSDDGKTLTQELWMSTTKTPELTSHLVAIYKKA